MLIKQELEKLLKSFNYDIRKIKNLHKHSKYKKLYDNILEKTYFLKNEINISERVYCILNNISEIQICKNEKCNIIVKFETFGRGYRSFCSGKCSALSDATREKFKKTSLEKYGKENPFQSEKIKNKHKLTCLKKYGVEYISQSKECKNKIKTISLERYGVENYTQCDEYKEKSRKTSLEKYGTEIPSKSPIVKETTRLNNLAKYGVEWPMQNVNIFEKNQNSRLTFKLYILPSGKEVKVQGYENKFLDEYFNSGGLESNILIKTKDIHKHIGMIFYHDLNGKKHKYYPDCYLINENKIIEVKSTYTYDQNKDENELKRQASLDKGLNFEFVIYNSGGIRR